MTRSDPIRPRTNGLNPRQTARDLYNFCTRRGHGVLLSFRDFDRAMAMAGQARFEFDIVATREVTIPASAGGEVLVTFELVGGDLVDLQISPHAWSRFEELRAAAAKNRPASPMMQ